MKLSRKMVTLLATCLVLAAGGALAQYGWWDEQPPHDDRRGVPDWDNSADFKQDVFTFVRIQYDDNYGGYGGRRGWGRRGGKWAIDYPDCELNFSYRLQQLTSMKVNP